MTSHSTDGGCTHQHLISDVCSAIDQGDDVYLADLLKINIANGKNSPTTHEQGVVDTAKRNDPSSNASVDALLDSFYCLIGHTNDSLNQSGDDTRFNNSKTDLVLKALLRVSLLDPSLYMISWHAATAFIKSLQYSNSNCTNKSISDGEELKMITEIRHFLSSNILSTISSLRGSKIKLKYVDQTSDQLLFFGLTVIAPLLRSSSTQVGAAVFRRQRFYLLPLELIPAILSVADAIDDVRLDLCEVLAREEFTADVGMKDEDHDSIEVDANRLDHEMKSNLSQKAKCYVRVMSKEDVKISVSDAILTELFTTKTPNSTGLTIRADAALPTLALAIDDIRSGHMSSICPVHGKSTYWDCLRRTLSDVFASSITCCTEKSEAKDEVADQISLDEGFHIIPHTDYPALLRCIFRMITVSNSSSYTRPIAWVSLLLHSYHAAIVAALSPSSVFSKQQQTIHRMSILNTIEVHVLVPTFTVASVPMIRTVLTACAIECCPSCKRGSFAVNSMKEIIVPSFVIARMVLLIMRAKVSLSRSNKNALGFCPRSIFDMATSIILREENSLDEQNGVDSALGNEFDLALKVLLSLSDIESGLCHTCSDLNESSGADNAAYEVLTNSYYGIHGNFCPRYTNLSVRVSTYLYDLGHSTLSSYANLVRSSITHGRRADDKPQSVESFVTDAAKAWLDAAFMLLDDSSKREKSKSIAQSDYAAFAAVILIVVFFEVPTSCTDVIRYLSDRLTSNQYRRDSILSIVSMLAWSKASRVEGPSSIIFSRKDDRLRDGMSVFGPLGSLLSRPLVSQELDTGARFLALNETQPLSYGDMLQIARSLISVPSARDTMLSMAKKHMRAYEHAKSEEDPSAVMNSFFESMISTQSVNRDAVYFASACFCLLIQTHDIKNLAPDDCGCEALAIITDIMVLRRPSATKAVAELPSEVMYWILAEINRAVSSGRVSIWACQRLSRACSYALLKSCTMKGDTDSHVISATFFFGDSSLATYVTGLLRLSVSLYEHRNIGYNCPGEIPLTSYIIETLLQKDNGQEEIMKGFNIIDKGFVACDETSTAAIDRALLTLFIRGAGTIFHGNITSQIQQTNQSQNIERYLHHSEHFQYAERARINQESLMIFPDWLKGIEIEQGIRTILPLSSREAIKKSDQFNQMVSSLRDLFVELLAKHCVVEISDSNSEEVSISESDLVKCLNLLQQRKQTHTNSTSMCCLNMHRLVSIYSSHLQRLLKSNQQEYNLTQLEVTIRHVFSFCNLTVTSTAKKKSYSERQFASVWSLYCSIADEHSSRALILITLGVYKETGWAPPSVDDEAITAFGVDESTFSLTAISSDEAFDYQILYIRTTVLTFLSHLMSLTPECTLGPAERRSMISLLTHSLLKLCSDMSDGFQGRSGGMRKSLFMNYTRAIDGCISNIASIVDTLSVSMLDGCLPSFVAINKAIIVVWTSFCQNSFKEAFLVKMMLKLCVDKLPGLIRKIEAIAGRRIDSNIHLMPCVSLLEHVSAFLLAAARGHADPTTADHVDPRAKTHCIVAELDKPDFASSNVAMWACNIALASISTVWHKSNKVIVAANWRGLSFSTIPSTDRIAFSKLLANDFQCWHTSVCKMFERIENLDKASNAVIVDGAAENPDASTLGTILAEELSHRGKAYVCSCIDKMSITLSSSIKTVICHLSRSANLVDPKTMEALSCIMGCCSSIISQDSKSYDVITGPIRWFAAESQDGYPAVNYSILHRLTKTIYRSESIEMELHKLARKLKNGTCEGWNEHMQILNEMTSSASADVVFSDLLERCSRIVQSRMASLKTIASDTGLFSDGEDGSIDDDSSFGNGKRRIGFASSRSRRMSLRSRNETIDDWLTLDNEDLATGERFNADDAFADLEDFLVEG